MKAWVLEEYNSPLILQDVDDPVCGDDDVIVKTVGAGVCRTDLKIYHGHLDWVTKLPHIQGHEISGVVAEVGKNVKTLKPGDRGIVYHYIACRDCEFCRTGRENICEHIKRAGFELKGGFAEYVSVPAYNFCKTDIDYPLTHLSVLPDAVATSYHSIKTLGQLKASDKLLIIGLGGLGLHGVQVGKMIGAEVGGIDLRPEALKVAREQGADFVLDANDDDLVEKILDWSGGLGADVVIDGVGIAGTFSTALKYLKRGGRLVLMGYDPLNPIPLDALGMHYNEWSIIGSRLGTKQELMEIMEHIGRGKLKPLVTEVLPVSDVNRIFTESLIEKNIGRIVLDCDNFS
ncbi:MAG: alcohol dehydrogenase catalytic domain-containing protein [Spirochaetales bacterium]|uniref:Alcohol dehydrogenase catalytic domain-containing protein n=1 Tax=Candidatus Thalassospirochaeta sargassi TaxID=3119039 RepID=A0AAJ1MLA8_9SPIO|nr:alcohol dehydrogenase catalytic domain-containing protein [Spirochaetales bacterium]